MQDAPRVGSRSYREPQNVRAGLREAIANVLLYALHECRVIKNSRTPIPERVPDAPCQLLPTSEMMRHRHKTASGLSETLPNFRRISPRNQNAYEKPQNLEPDANEKPNFLCLDENISNFLQNRRLH